LNVGMLSETRGVCDSYGPLLCLDRRDVAGLVWIKTRSRMWINGLKRRRKYQVERGAIYTPEESAVIETLADLENAVGRLLKLIEADGK